MPQAEVDDLRLCTFMQQTPITPWRTLYSYCQQ